MKKNAAFAALLLGMAAPCFAVDGVSFELGHGEGTDMWRVGLQWRWQKKWFGSRGWRLGGYWDLSLGAWKNERTITDLGLTPVFRLESSDSGWPAPYFEAAIGFHQLSEIRVSSSKTFSTNFQFGDHVGAGLRFGRRGRYDVSLRYQHVSNGGIRRPNPGINFTQLRLQYHYDE